MAAPHIELQKLEVYSLSRRLSLVVWSIYEKLTWQTKKVIGDQFIESTDSVGANIAEGYGRYHYLDRIKFFYNARGSLLESKHWIELMSERKLLADQTSLKKYLEIYEVLVPKLNGWISAVYKAKSKF